MVPSLLVYKFLVFFSMLLLLGYVIMQKSSGSIGFRLILLSQEMSCNFISCSCILLKYFEGWFSILIYWEDEESFPFSYDHFLKWKQMRKKREKLQFLNRIYIQTNQCTTEISRN